MISAFPLLFSPGYSAFAVAALCALGVSVSAFFSVRLMDKLRFLGLVSVAACLLLCRGMDDLITMLPPLLYCAAVVFRDDFGMEYYSFLDYFQKAFLSWAVGFGIIFVWGMFESTLEPDAVPSVMLETPFVLGMFFGASGVLLLRKLRIGLQSKSSASDFMQIFCVLLAFGLFVYIANSYSDAIGETVFFLFEMVIALPVMVFLAIMNGILAVVNWLGVLFPGGQDFLDNMQEMVDGMQRSQNPLPTETQEAVESVTQSGYPWFGAVLILSVTVVGLLLLLRIFRPAGIVAAIKDKSQQLLPEKQKPQRQGRSNRQKVRRYYRSFLKQEKLRGMRLTANHTSEDVLRSISSATDPDGASQLRQIYLQARYREDGQITQEQVRSAKNALKKSKGTSS